MLKLSWADNSENNDGNKRKTDYCLRHGIQCYWKIKENIWMVLMIFLVWQGTSTIKILIICEF